MLGPISLNVDTVIVYTAPEEALSIAYEVFSGSTIVLINTILQVVSSHWRSQWDRRRRL